MRNKRIQTNFSPPRHVDIVNPENFSQITSQHLLITQLSLLPRKKSLRKNLQNFEQFLTEF